MRKITLTGWLLVSTLLTTVAQARALGPMSCSDAMALPRANSFVDALLEDFSVRLKKAHAAGDMIKNVQNPHPSITDVVHSGYADPVVGESTVKFVDVDGRKQLKKVGSSWFSSRRVRHNAFPGNPMGVVEVLGVELAGFLGIHVIDGNTIDVTDFLNQEFIDQKVKLLREKTGLYFPRIRIVDGDIAPREFLENFKKEEVTISKSGDIFIHDLTYHLFQFFLGEHMWQAMSGFASNALLTVDIAQSLKYFESSSEDRYPSLKYYVEGMGVLNAPEQHESNINDEVYDLGQLFDALTGNLRNVWNTSYNGEDRLGLAMLELAFNIYRGANFPIDLNPKNYPKPEQISRIREDYLKNPNRRSVNTASYLSTIPDDPNLVRRQAHILSKPLKEGLAIRIQIARAWTAGKLTARH